MFRFSRVAAALLVAQLLLFSLVLAPEHVSAHASHETCHICAFLYHPPVLQTGAIAVARPTRQKEFTLPLESQPVILAPRPEDALTRAPPSRV